MARIINGRKKASSLKEWILWQLRRLSYRWPERGKAFEEARRTHTEFLKHPGVKPAEISRRIKKFFQCRECGYIFPRKNVSADHRIPVVDPKKGWESWDIFIPRLFCEADNFQILCGECHDAKTDKEREVRTKYRRLRK